MADGDARSVAEKLAAAKRKHKAYMKGKGLRTNVAKSKNPESETVKAQSVDIGMLSEGVIGQQEQITESNLNNFEHSESKEFTVDNPYETDLPLPQYSMDFNNQQVTSLPDPLSFFDNFSNVGATFQNFAQPIASFFTNNDSINNQTLSNVVESPNQILIEHNTQYNVNTVDDKSTLPDGVQGIFSYDKFKSNAINDSLKNHNVGDSTGNNEEEELKNGYEIAEVVKPFQFDEFTNSNCSVDAVGDQEHLICDPAVNLLNKLQQSSLLNALDDKQSNHFKSSENALELEVEQSNQQNTLLLPELAEDNERIGNNTKDVDSFKMDLTQSNTDNLLRIANKMEALIERENKSSHLSDETQNGRLAKENQELLNLLNQENFKTQQLTSQLYESEIKYSKLLTDFKTLEIQKETNETDLKLQSDISMQNDLSKLREDLQCHLQTIGMLVAEKTELSTLLHETQSALKNETSHRIDLENQIKEIKLFYFNLEHDLEELKSEKANLSSSQKEQADLYNTRCQDYKEIKNKYEELTQDFLETKEKLKSMMESNLHLQNQVEDLNGQLSLANIKIQQLTVGGTQQESQVDKFMEEKFEFEKQISFLNQTLKTITKEREESSIQYQQYAQHLSDQMTILAGKLEQYQKENDLLKIQEENRIKHIGELEKQLQSIQSDNTSSNVQRNNSFLKKELETSTELLKNLQEEKEELNITLNKTLVDKGLIEKELEGCKFSISQLELSVEQLRGSQPDNTVLLATMESDKIAASRAIAQNNELKKQMEGMQEVLLKVNNDNVNLTESLTHERRTNKDLLDKLQKTEISLQTLAEAIEIKDKELVNLRGILEETSKQVVQQEQISDRLRHYEAIDHSSSSLQVELQDAKHMISHLTNELNILKKNQLNQANQIDSTYQNIEFNEKNVSKQSDLVDELRLQLSNLQVRNVELESLLQNFNESGKKSTDTNGNENLDRETAMKHLEKKFLKTMEEIAGLTEEKQRLEHLVLQLQGETETIGEYVTLYQQQRSILKQRALEKDQQLQQLTNDRETIKANLDRLNNLVNKLIVEKGAITKELLEQHEHFSKERDDLCEEHQKIHQEINKITRDGLMNSEVSDNSNTQIAEEIISLLSDIKSSNLVQPVEGIHHCPWCSGKLITV